MEPIVSVSAALALRRSHSGRDANGRGQNRGIADEREPSHSPNFD
jgi:hypothetical protein